MEGYLLQPWTCLTAASTIPAIAQDESGWLDLTAYQDIVLWTLCGGLRGGTNIRLNFETAPAKDELLFAHLDHINLAASPAPTITKVVTTLNPTLPLARWLRWTLVPASPLVEWGATFQVHCSARPIRGARL